MGDIEKQEFYKHMTFACRKNVGSLIKALGPAENMKKVRTVMYPSIIIIGLLKLYVDFKDYTNMLFVPIIVLLGIEIVEKLTAPAINRVEAIRKAIIANLNSDSFNCEGKCECDQMFQKFMLDKYNIKLF
jgi:hypothetical protein